VPVATSLQNDSLEWHLKHVQFNLNLINVNLVFMMLVVLRTAAVQCPVSGDQVIFISTALYTVQIVSKQLHRDEQN